MKLRDYISNLPPGFLEAVWPLAKRDDDGEEVMKLQIGLMFPLVDDAFRSILMAAWYGQRALALAANGGRDELTEKQRARCERQTNEIEARWMDVQACLKEMMRMVRLTKAQRAWIKEELMTPPVQNLGR